MNRLMRFFTSENVPVSLQDISKPCAKLATQMDALLVESAEKTAGLRKLLEAKDAFLRALLEEQASRESSKPNLISPAHRYVTEKKVEPEELGETEEKDKQDTP
jgi:hypothetical protein